MKKGTVAIIGYGHVGQAIHKIFPNAIIYNHHLTGEDEDMERQRVNECELAIVSVPTPEDTEKNTLDCSIVEDTIKWLETDLILLKSTVYIGFTDEMVKKYEKKICMSPEYYGESRYYQPSEWFDPIEWPYLIVGGPTEWVDRIFDFFIPILGPLKTYARCKNKEAEATKLMENIFFATKVTFCNEMELICEHNGVSYNNVRELWGLDPRLSKMHSSVFKNNRGFSGKCYPKDLAGLIGSARRGDYEPEFLLEVQKTNRRFRAMNMEHKEETK